MSPIVIAADGSAVFWRDHAVTRVSPDGKRLELNVNRVRDTLGSMCTFGT